MKLKHGPAPAVLAPNGKPWNIYLLQGDDFVRDIIGAEGMPTLMASYYSQFFHFPNACAEIPVCFPGRAATLTGVRGIQSGVTGNNSGAAYEPVSINHTIFRAMRRRGYKNAFVGKAYNNLGKGGAGGWGTLPWIHPDVDFQRIQWGGIGYFDWNEVDDTGNIAVVHGTVDTNAAGTDYAVDVERLRILQFLSETPVGKPWFIYHSTKGCHTGDGGAPIPPARYAATPVTYTDDASFGLSIQESGVGSWILDEQDAPWNAGARNDIHSVHTEALRVARALDEALNVIWAEITARGEWDNTIVILKTDNTIASGEHRLSGKGTPHRSGLGCQLHVRVPGLTPSTSAQPLQDLDIAAFICAMTGARMDWQSEGYSFHKHLQDTAVAHREAAMCVSYSNSSPFASLRFADRTYYEVQAHEEVDVKQPGTWLYSDGETENQPSLATDATALSILQHRLGTII